MFERLIDKPELSLEDDICVIDIETAGLVRERDPIYILGILTTAMGTTHFHQFATTAANPAQEAILLTKLQTLAAGKTWLTYNGNSFDLPYIEARLKHQQMKPIAHQSMDLYPWIRTRRKFFDFPRLNLKTLEAYAGINRQDALTGAQVAAAYRHIEGNPELLDQVLLHNEEDVLSTYQLYHYFTNLRDQLTIPISLNQSTHTIELISYQRDKDFATISYLSKEALPLPWQKQNSFGRIHWEDRRLNLRIPCHLGKLSPTSDDILDVGVLPTNGHNLSPHKLRPPLIALADSNRVYVENLHLVVRAFIEAAD